MVKKRLVFAQKAAKPKIPVVIFLLVFLLFSTTTTKTKIHRPLFYSVLAKSEKIFENCTQNKFEKIKFWHTFFDKRYF